ncbi:MAG TPA: hypothetical protein VG992_01800 [Candidatus Saccharimonadales bacterium]|nr:hypothetical protein [Candidatus Saccharimonadales bacterium]
MAERDRRYWIKIPAGPEIAEDFVPVDPSTLHLGVITDLYVWDSQQRKHRPVLGLEGWVNTDLDATALTELWSELMVQLQAGLVNDGVAGRFAQELRGALDDLPQLLELLAAGRMGAAQQAMQAMAYGLMQAASTATVELTELEARALAQSALAEGMVGIVAGHDDRITTEAVEFVDALEKGLGIYDHLEKGERELKELIERLEKQMAVCNNLELGQLPAWLNEHLEWFSELSEDGFRTRASRYMQNPDPAQADIMVKAAEEAQARVQKIRAEVRTAAAEQASARATTEPLLAELTAVTSQMRLIRQYREVIDRGIRADIDDYALTSELLSRPDFERWQALQTDQDWSSLHAVETRLRDLADIVRSLLDQTPRLNVETERTLVNVQSYIERLEGALDLQPTIAAVELAASLPAMDDEDADEDESEYDSDYDRLQELYELVVAVGAVRYCGQARGYLMGTQLRVILDILEILQRITEEERLRYRNDLQEMLDSYSYNVEADGSGLGRIGLWRELDNPQIHWIRFQQSRGKDPTKFWYWRLVQHARQRGLDLCAKHDLRSEDILEAYQTRTDQRLAKRKPFSNE